jgi:5-(carboxyamino)imidazole ribonucleotide synthase
MSERLAPGATVGILGGGQLGRMLAMAAAKLGLRARVFAPEADSPAFQVSEKPVCAPFEDIAALRRFAEQCGVITYEFENVPAHSLAVIEELRPVFPPRRALVSAQDRLAERRLLQACRLPHADFEFVAEAAALEPAFTALRGRGHATAYLKKLRHGYDGKGQLRLEGSQDIAAAQDWLGREAAILEAAVPFLFESSVIAARARDGDIVCYEPARNTHTHGILSESRVPSGLPERLIADAFAMTRAIMERLDYVGVIGVEMFAIGGDKPDSLVINEIAPRVHNSGHWTLEACTVSQFENHIRAVAGWPLGSAERHADARMVNLIGEEADAWADILAQAPHRSLHLYGKAETRPGRKMGHYCDLTPLNRAPSAES